MNQADYLSERAKLIKQLAGKLQLKKYMNEPPFSHKLNPLQGLFLKIDSEVDASELNKLFNRNIMSVELLK